VQSEDSIGKSLCSQRTDTLASVVTESLRYLNNSGKQHVASYAITNYSAHPRHHLKYFRQNINLNIKQKAPIEGAVTYKLFIQLVHSLIAKINT
jgi:hypothetical protein